MLGVNMFAKHFTLSFLYSKNNTIVALLANDANMVVPNAAYDVRCIASPSRLPFALPE